MPDRVDQQIGNYRLVRLLGSGGSRIYTWGSMSMYSDCNLRSKSFIPIYRALIMEDF